MPPGRPQGLISGSGRKGRPVTLPVMASLRFPPPLIAQARQAAADDGITLSDWIRNAVAAELLHRQPPGADLGLRLTGYQCEHLSITGSPPVTYAAQCMLGCDMQPVYRPAAS